MSQDDYLPLVQLALQEDLGKKGDITTDALFSHEESQAVLISKENGVAAGAEVFCAVYRELDEHVKVDFAVQDGDSVAPGEKIAEVAGPVASILTGERTAINFFSFLSGIATATRRFVEAAKLEGKAVILDTRKTLPGYRALSKYAVRCGGGSNHRQGLYDMVLIKDNHIDYAGSITKAVKAIRRKLHEEYSIEVECRTIEEVKEALACNVDIVMLDNMDEEQVKEAVMVRNGPGFGHHEFVDIALEASGNMDIERVGIMSRAGVNYISVGSLTHSVKGIDFSLKTEIPL